LGTKDPKPVQPMKKTVKGVLRTAFKIDNHIYNHPQVLAEASIVLKSDTPVQEFSMTLQELLKNGQLVDKAFFFCPVKDDGQAKRISDPSAVPTNMTLLSAFFKIYSMKGRNPFEKQKVWKNNKEVKGELRDPTVSFTFAFATDEDPEDLLYRVSHEWHRRGGSLLKLKELQTFESKTILCLFNVFTLTPKKTILSGLQDILTQALELAEENEAAEFHFDIMELPRHSKLPAIELRQQNPKLPGQDTSHYNKLFFEGSSQQEGASCQV
jgi:hypothetical protein